MAVLMLVAVSVKAATIPATNFAELQAAVESAAAGDVIAVTGEITAAGAISIEKSIIIEGSTNPAAKIISDGSNRVFAVNVPEGVVWFKNLTLSNGVADGNGGAVAVAAGLAHFTNCTFSKNKATDGGGAVYGEGEVQIEFYNCTFSENYAAGNGGAIRVAKGGADVGPKLSLEHCLVTLNSSDNRGGAMSLETPTQGVTLLSTVVSDNRTTTGKEGTGGIRITGGTFPFYARGCSFFRNLGSGDHAGFMIIDGDAPKTVTFVNSTINKNVNGERTEDGTIDPRSEGGAGDIWITGATNTPDMQLTFVNVTMAENTSGNGGNGDNSSGICFQDGGYNFNVFNSIIVGNVAGGAKPNGAVDISVRALPKEGGFVIKNSVIGCVFDAMKGSFDDPTTWFTAGVPWTIDSKSVVQEYNYQTNGDWASIDATDGSGIYMLEGGAFKAAASRRGGVARGYYYYTFLKDALATTLGDPALLTEEDVDNDMFLVTREIKGGTIWAGAYQGETESNEAKDPTIPADPFVFHVGIKNVVTASDQISLNTFAENGGNINFNFGQYAGHVKAELISINGQTVKTLINHVVNGTYPCDIAGVASGLYLVKITLSDNSTIAKRVLIK
ncbi:hypothetical protein AGMMS50262_04850 [Bacteroidia bacterium]|nr:hypothetical protein AGMMS50262_04850 [Bacteroidia bacterium]